MNKGRLIVTCVLAALVLAVALSYKPRSAPEAQAGQPEPDAGELIARVYFSDLETAHKIAISTEPLQSDYDKGYLVVAVSQAEYKRLQAQGLRLELDTQLMQDYAELSQSLTTEDVVGIQSIPGFSCYRTVEETFATAQSIVSNYPNLASWVDVGNTWEKTQGLGGYDMQVLRLTNSAVPGPKPIIFITSAIHAREYTTAELITRLAEKLVSEHGTEADATWILDYQEVHLMLQANPDGRIHAEAGQLWRKNTNQNYCGSTSSNRGADLNRNFAFNWGCCGGSSSNQCSQTYRGASAGSEPETQAVQNYILSNYDDNRGPNQNDPAPAETPGLYLDVHSSGRLLLWPWGHTSTPAPNGTALQTLGRKLAYFNGHSPMQSIGLYPTDGTTNDFSYGEMGIASFTYELGTEFFESCTYFENTLVPDNMPSLMYALKVGRTPYITPAGPDALNVSLSAGSDPGGVPAGTVVNLTATLDDTRFNNSNGTEPTQDVIAAAYYVDTPPWNGGTAVPMSASDGNFSSAVEGVQASVDTSGWSEGQHILYVRGQDANGNWGAVGAVFLYIDNGAATPTPTATPTASPTPPPPGTCTTYNSSEVPRALPNGTSSISSALNVSGSSTIADIDVDVAMDHAWVGDLTFVLRHQETGTAVTIIDRPGVPSSTWGCSNDDILATLDDEAAASVENQCAGSSPTINGTFSPNQALSAFNGENGNGSWLLEVSDAYTSADDGTLNAWSVEICTAGGPTPTPPPPTATPTATPTAGPTSTPTATPTPSPTSPAPSTVFFDDFESDQGWVTDPSGTDTATTGQWERGNPESTSYSGAKQLGNAFSGSNDLVTARLAGSSVGANDIDNGVTSVRSPNITLPGSGNLTLSFAYYLSHYSNATSADFLRVTVVGNTTQTVFEELGAGNDDDAAWETFSSSLNSFAGETVYLLIEAADASSASLVEAAIDDVRIEATP